MHNARCGRSTTNSRTRGAKARAPTRPTLSPNGRSAPRTSFSWSRTLLTRNSRLDEERPQLLARNGLHMHALEPPRAHELRVSSVRKLRSVLLCNIRRKYRGLGMPGLDAAHGKASILQAEIQPLRQRPCLKTDAFKLAPSNADSAALMAAGSDDIPLASAAIRPLDIHHAYARQLERDIYNDQRKALTWRAPVSVRKIGSMEPVAGRAPKPRLPHLNEHCSEACQQPGTRSSSGRSTTIPQRPHTSLDGLTPSPLPTGSPSITITTDSWARSRPLGFRASPVARSFYLGLL